MKNSGSCSQMTVWECSITKEQIVYELDAKMAQYLLKYATLD